MRARTAPPGVRPKEISGPSSRVTTFCCLLALATSALAENSWTLWMIDASSPWDSLGTFSTRELCMEALHRQIQAVEKLGRKVSEDETAGSFLATGADRDIRGQCLADTDAPRGPKGK
jgi:hypothetical protein